MSERLEITQADFCHLLEYREGEMFWKVSRRGTAVGTRAGYVAQNGYRYIAINRRMCLEHRLVFLMHHNYLPDFVDHINRQPLDNRIENLRPCTRAENNRNMRGWGKTGVKGVHWSKSKSKFVAQITVNRKVITVGSFHDLDDASAAISKARNEHHGEFAKH